VCWQGRRERSVDLHMYFTLVQCATSVFNVRTVITGTWIKAGGPMINEIEGPSPYLRLRYTT